jgi:hypothetical protein
MSAPSAKETLFHTSVIAALMLLLLPAFFAGPALASTASSVTVNSVNQDAATITGYRTVLFASNGTILAESFTPSTFTTTAGDSYSVQSDSYGSCTFTSWSDGVTNNPRAFTATSSAVTFTAEYNCTGSSATSSATVDSVNQNGTSIPNYPTTLYASNGTAIKSGLTPQTYTTTVGDSYGVSAESSGPCTFTNWSDGVTSDPRSFTATSSAVTFTAVYDCSTTTPSQSTVSVSSENQFGNTITGYYTALFNSSEKVVASGFTPAKFNTTSGQSYSLVADGYGSCTFTSWSDGVTSDPRSFTATSSNLAFIAQYDCAGASEYSHLAVSSVNEDGSAITGYAITIFNSDGAKLASGTTPLSFATTIGQSYEVQAGNGTGSGGSCTFSFWVANSTSDLPITFTATSSNQTLPAAYNCNNGGSTSITVYAHRIPAGYWAACFATVCAAGTGPGASMYFALINAGGTVVATGFANENGLTFTGLVAGATYYLQADDCDGCHGSTHDVLFNHWGNNDATDPIAIVAGSSIDAWYNCTNGCGGD